MTGVISFLFAIICAAAAWMFSATDYGFLLFIGVLAGWMSLVLAVTAIVEAKP